MCDRRQLRSISINGVLWAVCSACMPAAPAKRADPDDVHTFAVEHGKKLEVEIGSGGGPNVRTLAVLAKCPNIISAARRLTELKGTIYPAPNLDIAADRLVAVLGGDAELGCKAAYGPQDDGSARGLPKHGEAPAKNAADRANMKEQYPE